MAIDVNWHSTVAHDGTDLAKAIYAKYLEKRFLPGLKANLVVHTLGVESTLPSNMSTVAAWNLVSTPGADVTDIGATSTGEGSDPAETDLTTSQYTAELLEYGGTFVHTKFLMVSALSGTMDQVVDRMQYKAGLTIDTLCYAEADATSASVDSGTSLTADAIRSAVALLGGAGTIAAGTAMPHPRSPGGKFYVLVASPEAASDMIGEGSPTWSQAKSRDVEYAFTTPLDGTPETSSVYGAIVKTSSVVTRNTGTAPDDDQNLLVGADAFGVASLASDVTNPRVIVTTPDQLVSAPARNRGTVAYWFLYAAQNFDSKRSALILSDATGT